MNNEDDNNEEPENVVNGGEDNVVDGGKEDNEDPENIVDGGQFLNEDRRIDKEGEVEINERKNKAKRQRDEGCNEKSKAKPKKKKKVNDEDEDDIVERFEFEIEESIAEWCDEFRINGNTIPDSDEEEDPIVIRDRKIRISSNDRLAIGRTFLNAFDFKEAVLNHALKSRENIRQNKYGKEKLSFVCGHDKNCGWRVYCSFGKEKQLWVVRTTCGYHSCTPNGKCKLLKSPVIGKLFMDKLRMKPNFMPLDIQDHIKKQWNLVSTIGQVQRGRLLALKWLDEEYALHFTHLRGYVAELQKSNPGSTAIVETTSNAAGEDVFNRFYLCLKAMKDSFYFCRPILGIDGTFLKRAVKGCLLTAIAHDANNQIIPVAWAAVQTENADNWTWFLKLLKTDLNLKDGTDRVIISDRSKGIISSVKEELPNAEHRMCVKHIVENLKSRHANKNMIKGHIWPLAWSYNEGDYKKILNKIRDYSMSLYEDVLKEDPKNWCRAHFKIGSCVEDVDNNAT